MGRSRSLRRVSVAAAVLALAATSCLSEEGGGSGGGGGTASGDKQVEIVFGFGGDQSKGFQQSLQEFQNTSGIKIKFTEASQSFDTLIRTRVRANNLPDIALFPQPGILKDFVKQGKMTELGTQLDVEKLKAEYVPGTLDAGLVDGKIYGAPISYNLKSLVFYPKTAFEAKGYTAPTTQQELTEPVEQDQDRRHRPVVHGHGVLGRDRLGGHRLGREQRPAFEAGPETYDKWVNHEIPFDDPAVKTAADRSRASCCRRQRLRRPQADGEHRVRHLGEPDVRQPAALLPAPAGQLHHPERLLPEEHRRRHRQPGRRLPATRARRPGEADARRRRPGRVFQRRKKTRSR